MANVKLRNFRGFLFDMSDVLALKAGLAFLRVCASQTLFFLWTLKFQLKLGRACIHKGVQTSRENHWQYYNNKPTLVQIGLKLFKWDHFHISAYFTTWPLMTFDLGIWPLTTWTYEGSYHINKPSLVPIRRQLFKWGHFQIFSLSYNLTSDDLWPWYVTFDLINNWGLPCCIYDLTLVEIHRSMWKL